MIKEIRQVLSGSLEVSNFLDLNKLPEYARQSVEFLKSDTPDEVQLMVLNLTTAQMMSYNRIKFSWQSVGIIWKPLMNLYWINFLDSGWGKNKTIEAIDYYLMDFFKEKFKKNNDKYIEAESEKVVKQADIKFWTKALAQKQAYVKEHSPRPFMKKIWDATAEWFEVNRQQLYKAWFGSMFVEIDELSLYIKSMKSETVSFFRSLISSYEGNHTPKVIKSEIKVITTEWIPNNVLMYSSVSWLLSGMIRERFMEFLEIWFARRAFICYPNIIKKELPDSWEAFEEMELEKEWKKPNPVYVKNKLKTAFEKTDINKDIFSWEFNEIVFELKDKEAVKYYKMYKFYCWYISEQYSNNIQKIEIRERYWRMIKLATLIASIEHPEDRQITVKDLEYATYQVEFFGKQAQKFFNDESSDVELLFNFIVEKWEVNKTTIRDELKAVSKDRFPAWFDRLRIELADYCDDCGMVLKEIQWKWRTKLFTIKHKQHTYESELDKINNYIENE